MAGPMDELCTAQAGLPRDEGILSRGTLGDHCFEIGEVAIARSVSLCGRPAASRSNDLILSYMWRRRESDRFGNNRRDGRRHESRIRLSGLRESRPRKQDFLSDIFATILSTQHGKSAYAKQKKRATCADKPVLRSVAGLRDR